MPRKLGRYDIVRVLGKGAMGVVYEGKDPQIGRRVAIKTARGDVMGHPDGAKEMLERFLREARAAGILNHPNIITIYDVGEEDGTAFIAMEFVEGEDLAGHIASRRRYPINEAVSLIASLCEGLACAHDQGIVHRDIKPANIMLPKNGPAKIADFGIARVSDSHLTQEGALIGTPSYMSPEQFMGHPVDGRSDLFSLTIILYELLTGERPFAGEAFSTIMHHVIRTDPIPPHELNFTVPEPLGRVVLKALAKRPQDRYSNGRAMAAALRESVKDQPDSAVLEETLADTGSTLVGGAPQAGPSMDATMPAGGARPAQDSPTIPGRQVNATRAGQLETVAGKPPSPHAAPNLDDYADPHRVRDISPAPNRPGVGLLLGLAAALGLMIIAGVTWFSLNSGDGGTPPVAEPPPAEAMAPPVTPAVKEVTILVAVYATNDPNVALDFQSLPDGESSLLEFIRTRQELGKIRPLNHSGISVSASDKSGVQLSTEPVTEEGYARVSIPENAEAVTYSVLDGAEVLDSFTLPAPGWKKKQTFLIHTSN